jgi:hypothetical protein
LVARTYAELFDALRKQVRFFRTSAAAFDAGDTAEAARSAVAIRVLVHDAGRSFSVLRQLGVKDRLRFVDTATPLRPGNAASTNGLVVMTMSNQGGDVFVPPLDNLSDARQGKPRLSFPDWWEAVVIIDILGSRFSRKDLVLALANSDGGAHVDPQLTEAYAALSRSGSLGWIVGNCDGQRPLLRVRCLHLSARSPMS